MYADGVETEVYSNMGFQSATWLYSNAEVVLAERRQLQNEQCKRVFGILVAGSFRR